MKKLIIILLGFTVLASCSKNYTGEYEHKFKVKKIYYVNTKTGKETTQIPFFSPFMSKSSRPQYKEVIRKIDSKMLLSIKQEKTKITGSMNISNEFNVTKFNIESGELNENGLLRLKLVKSEPIGTPSIGASIFSFAMPLKTRIQLNFAQKEAMNGNENLFNISAASNIPLFSSNGNDEVIAFQKR